MRRMKQRMACVLSLALLLGILPTGTTPASRAATELKNPTMESEDVAAWDCVYFGNYWQNDTNEDGKVDTEDAKEPIKWRVLSVDGDDAFLIADQNLDCWSYNDTRVNVTWETCTLRSWLNGYGAESNVCETDHTDNNFIDNAFSEEEQSAIKDTTVVNENSPEYGTTGGNDTTDKVYLLSYEEAANPSYGFATFESVYAKSRSVKDTAYAKERKELLSVLVNNRTEIISGWLRTPGERSDKAITITSEKGYAYTPGSFANSCELIRPVLHLNLSSESVWSYAGTVTSDEKPEPPVSLPSASPTVQPSASPSVQPSESPSVQPSESPSVQPSESPSVQPSESPSVQPSASPSVQPSVSPTVQPSESPSVQPSEAPASESKPAKVTGLKGKAKKKAIQVSWKKAAGANGYELCYSTSKKWEKKKTKTTKKTKLTLGKLKSKKTYYIRVRAYTIQNGKKVYGEWSKTVKKKVK